MIISEIKCHSGSLVAVLTGCCCGPQTLQLVRATDCSSLGHFHSTFPSVSTSLGRRIQSAPAPFLQVLSPKVHGVFSNRDLPLRSVSNTGNSNNLYCCGSLLNSSDQQFKRMLHMHGTRGLLGTPRGITSLNYVSMNTHRYYR